MWGAAHSSVDLSAPTILLPGYKSQAHHIIIYSQICARFDMWKERKKQKEAGLGPFKKKLSDAQRKQYLRLTFDNNYLKKRSNVKKRKRNKETESKTHKSKWAALTSF